MKLNRYDGKCVRLTDRWGDVFEGVCSHNGAEYSMHEFGREEESVQLSCLLVYKSNIVKIEELKQRGGPFGCFSAPYGKLEQVLMQGGVDLIEEVLSCEEPESVLRMLRCLAQEYDPAAANDAQRKTLFGALQDLIALTDDDEIRSAASHLLAAWNVSPNL